MSMNPSEMARKEQEEADALIEAMRIQKECHGFEPPPLKGGVLPYCYQCGRMTAPRLGDPCQEEPCGMRPIG